MTTRNEYAVGQLVRISAAFTNISGVATDPTAVLFKLRWPDLTLITYTYGVDGQLVKDSTGNYHVDMTLTKEGTVTYRYEGTGTVTAADEKQLVVTDSVFY